jgi:cytidylate kinase
VITYTNISNAIAFYGAVVYIAPYMAHKKKLHLWVSAELKEKAYRMAQSKGISISELIRHLIMKEDEQSSTEGSSL